MLFRIYLISTLLKKIIYRLKVQPLPMSSPQVTSKPHKEEGQQKGKKRGIVVVTDEDVTKRNRERIPANTPEGPPRGR